MRHAKPLLTQMPARAPVHLRGEQGPHRILAISAGLPVVGSVAVLALAPDWRGVHEPIHALMEAGGALFALVLIILLHISRHVSQAISDAERSWLSVAILCMGLFDALHALAEPGNTFVWLHSVAVLAGGSLLCGLWLGPSVRIGPLGLAMVIALCGAAGVQALVHPSLVPPMVSHGEFTVLARALNFVGGTGFMAGGYYFFRRWRDQKDHSLQLIVGHCILFGTAGFLFELSSIWDAAWWWWHALRLAAYAVLFGAFLELTLADDGWHRRRFDFDISSMRTLAVLSGGSLCLVMGTSVLAGWLLRAPDIIQLYPSFAPMQATTALCFVFAAAALLSSAKPSWDRLQWAACAGLLAISGLSLLAHALDLSGPFGMAWTFGLDMPRTDYQGRMSVNTALGFALSVGALLPNRAFAPFAAGHMMRSGLALGVFGVASASLLWYGLGQDMSQAPFGVEQVALHTAVGLFGLSTALVCRAYEERRVVSRHHDPHEGVLAAGMLTLLAEAFLPPVAFSAIFHVPLVLLALALRWPMAAFLIGGVASTSYLLNQMGPRTEHDLHAPETMKALAEIMALWGVASLVYLWKRQTRALAGVQDRYELAVQGGNLGLWDWSIAADALRWTPRTFAMLGMATRTDPMTRADLLGRLHPDDRRPFTHMVERHIASAEPFETECRLRHQDGHYLYVAVMGMVTLGQNGVPLRLSGSVTDITPMKNLVEENLRRLELLSLGEQIASIGNWSVDVVAGNVVWSDEVYRIHGFEPGAFTPNLESGIDFYVDEDRDMVRTCVERSIETGKGFDFQAHIRRPDGSLRRIHSKGVVRTDEMGTVHTIYGMFQDITESWSATERLRMSEERFSAAVTGMSVGLWDWIDVRGDAEWWSPRFYALLGYEDGEIPAALSTFRDHLHEDDRAATFDAVERHFQDRAPFRIEYRLRTKSGAYRWFLGTGQSIRDDSGRATRMIGTIMDIHELKAANEALQAQTRKLTLANQDLDHFAYIASHDLRAPLRGISNAATWLEEDLADHLTPESREHIQLLRSRMARMERLLTDILAYCRAGRQENDHVLVDMHDLIGEVTDWVDPPDGFSVQILTPLPSLMVSQSLLEQVFLNLIGNAVKHHDQQRGRITIGYTRTDPFHRFTVTDDGPGIPERFHQKAFTMFQTLQPRDKKEGSGIGLAIVKKMVASVGGRVDIRSPLGDRGTTFDVQLPILAGDTLVTEEKNDDTGTRGLSAAC